MLDIWPTLPIVVSCHTNHPLGSAIENVSAALEKRDRISEIDLRSVSMCWLEKFSVTEVATFPTLISLDLWNGLFFSDSFLLVGSAPRLRTLRLGGVSFQGVQRLLLSASDLVHLYLGEIPPSGYILPETMVTCLSMLTRLESLHLAPYLLHRPPLGPASGHPPPPTRLVLPALTDIIFKGDSDYLENLLSRIDAPLLCTLTINFHHWHIVFDTPQLFQFISRTEEFKLNHAYITFSSHSVGVTVSSPNGTADPKIFKLEISCDMPRCQLISLAQIFSSLMPPISTTLEHLELCKEYSSYLSGSTVCHW